MESRLLLRLALVILSAATSLPAQTAPAAASPDPAGGPQPLQANAVMAGPIVVTAARMMQDPQLVAASVRVLDREALVQAPTVTLDDALRAVPGFSLFRRSDSLTAHPTAQGVSLRGLGPSGASRSLVLLDGVPLNDPFGGWIAWTKVPREGLREIELVPSGGATAWGNSALGGVVQLLSRPPAFGVQRGSALALWGEHGTRSADVAVSQPLGSDAALQVQARAFATEGFAVVAPERRGPIDLPAWSRHRLITASWRQRVANVLLGATVRGYEEKRGNGTPYQRNGSREKFLSFTVMDFTGTTFTWNAAAYVQDQSFASTFGAINAGRTQETPASDQFAVPSTAGGVAWTAAWRHAHAAHTSLGVDSRVVRGETRENVTFANGDFTRQRVAGGKQWISGVFAVHERPLVSTLRATLGARVDRWSDQDGHRRETDRLSGALLRDDQYARQEGTTFSPSAGLVWRPTEAWRLRGTAQRAFRRPTLNELYRPFRVGPNVTEANAALGTEQVTSAELGAEWSLFARPDRPAATAVSGASTVPLQPFPRIPPRSVLTLSGAMFWNELHDAVGNVTIARGPGTFPIVGFVAAGGVGRQRLNLERTRVRGVELSARWRPTRTLTFSGDYLYNDAAISRAPVAPALVGKRLAQVPRHSAALSGAIELRGGVTLSPRVRWIGRQFEDDENQLRLGEVVVADLRVARRLTSQIELFLTAENLGDARIETGRTADGIVNLGTPRLIFGGVRGNW